MAFCTQCGTPLDPQAPVCPNCGTPVQAQLRAVPVYIDPADHTAEFDPADISANKVAAMAAYVLGIPGLIIAALLAKDSAYTGFHVRQSLKISIVNMLLALITAVLCWTVIVPIIGCICVLIMTVVKIICFVQVCGGKAKDAPIVSSLGFLK